MKIIIDNINTLDYVIKKIEQNSNQPLTILRAKHTKSANLIHIIKTILLKTEVTDLNLSSLNIKDKGIITLQEAFITSNSLTSLDLSNNGISRKGGIAIANVINNNSTMKKLNLLNNLELYKALPYIGMAIMVSKELEEISYDKLDDKNVSCMYARAVIIRSLEIIPAERIISPRIKEQIQDEINWVAKDNHIPMVEILGNNDASI